MQFSYKCMDDNHINCNSWVTTVKLNGFGTALIEYVDKCECQCHEFPLAFGVIK